MKLKYKYDQNLERKTKLTRPITRKKERETRKKGECWNENLYKGSKLDKTKKKKKC